MDETVKLKSHPPFSLQAYNCFVLNARNNYSARDQEERFIFLLFLHGAQCILKTRKILAGLQYSSCAL